MSVAEGGNGFPFLAPQVFQYIVKEDFSNFKVDVCDLPDGSLKFAVEEVCIVCYSGIIQRSELYTRNRCLSALNL